MKKFLVIQTASIGDVILSTPIIEKLYKYFPDAQIDILLKKGNESLFDQHPFLNKILIWDKSKNKYKNLYYLLKPIRKTKYDCVINVQRFASSGLLTAFSGAKQKIGFDKNPLSFLFDISIKHSIQSQALHETERNLKLIEGFTDSVRFPIKLYPSQANFAKIEPFTNEKLITISPASLWFTKEWPVEKWVEFLNKLKPEYKVYLLGSKTDIAKCESIASKTNYKQIEILAGQLSLLESTALMKSAVMNYVNDSAPMHLASSVDAPTAAIFCSTIPAFGFGPLSQKSFIIETKEDLDCRPCGLHGHQACPKTHFKCAKEIDPKQLLDILPK